MRDEGSPDESSFFFSDGLTLRSERLVEVRNLREVLKGEVPVPVRRMLTEIFVGKMNELAAGTLVIDQAKEELLILADIGNIVEGTATRTILDQHLARVQTTVDFKGMLQMWQLAIVT